MWEKQRARETGREEPSVAFVLCELCLLWVHQLGFPGISPKGVLGWVFSFSLESDPWCYLVWYWTTEPWNPYPSTKGSIVLILLILLFIYIALCLLSLVRWTNQCSVCEVFPNKLVSEPSVVTATETLVLGS